MKDKEKFVKKPPKEELVDPEAWALDPPKEEETLMADGIEVLVSVTKKAQVSRAFTMLVLVVALVGLPTLHLVNKFSSPTPILKGLSGNILIMPENKIAVQMRIKGDLVEDFQKGGFFSLPKVREDLQAREDFPITYSGIKGTLCGIEVKPRNISFGEIHGVILEFFDERERCPTPAAEISFVAEGLLYDFGKHRKVDLQLVPRQSKALAERVSISVQFLEATKELAPELSLTTKDENGAQRKIPATVRPVSKNILLLTSNNAITPETELMVRVSYTRPYFEAPE